MELDSFFLNKALIEANKALKIDEVPVGAVLVKDGKIIAKGYNLKEKKNDVTAHAEIEVIRKASKKMNTWRLDETTLYVTLEPCPMCAAAIMQSRIKRVVYGALDEKAGALVSAFPLYEIKGFNHYPTIHFEENENCGKIISNYFKNKR